MIANIKGFKKKNFDVVATTMNIHTVPPPVMKINVEVVALLSFLFFPLLIKLLNKSLQSHYKPGTSILTIIFLFHLKLKALVPILDKPRAGYYSFFHTRFIFFFYDLKLAFNF